MPPPDEAAAAAVEAALVWRVEGLALDHGCHQQLYDTVKVGRVTPAAPQLPLNCPAAARKLPGRCVVFDQLPAH